MRDFVWHSLNRPPKIADKAVFVVDRFNAGEGLWSPKQYRKAACKRLDIVDNVPKSLPDQVRNSGLAAKPRKRGLQAGHTSRFLSPGTSSESVGEPLKSGASSINLRLAIWQYVAFRSRPIPRNPMRSATNGTVPDPINGSNTTAGTGWWEGQEQVGR
jgi:hypothetical protein